MIDLNKLTDKKIWLAPLAGISDISFRTICKSCGADVVVSEMVSADGLLMNPEPSLRYARFTEEQRPFGIQLFGSDPEVIGKAVKVVEDIKPDFLDFNMGCPVKKVTRKGAGSALMKDPERAAAIVREIKKVLPDSIPLSVKIRSGWDIFSINVISFATKLEDSGADMICYHARTRSQMYSGRSNWEMIAELKKKLSIPVIGNGDIRTAEDAVEMFNLTGCDSVMIGRGAIGKPWLFREIKDLIEKGSYRSWEPVKKFQIIEEHCKLTCSEKNEEQAIKELRTHFAYYTKGFKGGSRIRDYIFRSMDLEDNLLKIKELYDG
ncbi:tRNA dihydrouridine synthase DusB [Candidatus Cloacimonadota bacterium]